MINVTDLRIGNYILYLDELYVVDGIKYEERSIHKWRITFRTTDGTLRNAKMLDWIKPVPLTPETLEKAGFVDVSADKNRMAFRRNVNSIDELCYYVQDGYLRYQTQASGFTRPLMIQYLHQLQNLYFFLTVEELPIGDCFVPRNDDATLSSATT